MSFLYTSPMAIPPAPASVGWPMAPVASQPATPAIAYAQPASHGEFWMGAGSYAPPVTIESYAVTYESQLTLLNAMLQLYQLAGQLLAGVSAPVAPAPPPAPAPTPPHVPTPPPTPAPGPSPARKTEFVLSSFNVLSSNAGAGKGFASGTSRIHNVVQILKNHHVSVVGFQEMDAAQLKEFKRIAGDTYGTFAGHSGKLNYHDTTLAWRKDTWDLKQTGHITVPSYGGRDSKVPYVRLRNKLTGQEAYFVDAHNPANTKNYHHQERFRDEAARREAALVKQLAQSGLPVFMVGDMNSVKEAQQIFTSNAPLKAANPPKRAGIDWIFGTLGVKFSDFKRTREGLIPRTTDHPVVFSNVTIGK